MKHVPVVLVAAAVASLLGPAARGASAAPASPPAPPKAGETFLDSESLPDSETGEPKRPQMPASVRWKAEVLTPTVLPCEPVLLDITWRNTSTSPVEYPDDQPLLFVVRKAGQKELRLFWIVRRIRLDRMIPLGPGETYTRKVPFVLGWEPGEAKPPKEFVLPEPGRYEIFIVGASNAAPLDVTVAEPASVADVAARKRWTTEAVRWLLGGRPDPDTVEPDLEAISSQYPTSRYAPWALWIRATIMAARGGAGGFAEAARLGETLVARYPDFPLREDAFKALVGVYAATGQDDRAREMVAELARLFPQSRHLAGLREQLAKATPRPKVGLEMPPPGAPVPRAAIQVSGTERIPPGARELFQTFWQAVGDGDFAAVERVLAGDFMSDYGSRPQYVPALWKRRRNARSGSIQVRVAKAEMAETYDRPRSIPSGAARTWHGTLCIVEGSLTVAWDLQGAGRDVARLPNACWVFYKSPTGLWKLVSETATTPNLLAAGLAQGVFSKLPRGLTTWRISDGQQDRAPYEEIKAQLGLTGKVADDRTRWVNHKLNMTGSSMTEPLLQGQIRMPLKSGAGPAGQWVVRDVHFCLALGPGGDLVLKRIDVRMPTPFTQPEPSELR